LYGKENNTTKPKLKDSVVGKKLNTTKQFKLSSTIFFMKQSKLLAGKSALLTLVFMLLSISITNQSCAPKLPSSVANIVSSLGIDVPKLFSQASGLFGSSQSAFANKILERVGQAASLTTGMGGKMGGLSDMFAALGSSNIQPFLDMWKQKGTLDAETISKATSGFNDALGAIKKVGKIK